LNAPASRPTGTTVPPSSKERRALVARIGALGDVLLTRRLTYSLSRAGFRSTLLAPARHASLLLADPWIEVILDSESSRLAEAFAGAWPGDIGLFDLAVILSRSAELMHAVGSAAREVIQVPPEPTANDVPIWRQWTEGAQSICTPFTGALPRLEVDAPAAIAPGAVLLHPGSGSPEKNWPLAHFIEVGRRLVALGHRVAWIRGPAEADLDFIEPAAEVIEQPRVQTLAATLARSSLFIGNDSGVSHLAAAVGAPTLAIFGPTSPTVWRPDGQRVETLRPESGALVDLEVERVVAVALDLARLGTSA